MSSKKIILRRLGAILLLIPVLVGSMGFSIDIHYCKGEVKSFKIYGDANACYEKKSEEVCSFNDYEAISIQRNKCCSDAEIIYRSTFESNTVLEINTQQVVYLISYPVISVDLIDQDIESYSWLDIIQPTGLPSGKKYALLETYLI